MSHIPSFDLGPRDVPDEPLKREHREIGREERFCDKHGPYTSIRWHLQPDPPPFIKPFWSSCPTCDGELQREVDAHHDAIMGGITAKQRAAAARMAEACIPAKFHEATVWNFAHYLDAQKHVFGWARDYCNGFEIAVQTGRSAMFIGTPGTGKTHLAIGILKHVMEKGARGIYATVMQLLSRIKNTYHRDAEETEKKAIEAFIGPDLLVIDEVGRQLDSSYEQAQLFRILDDRYTNLKPTILVSNLNQVSVRKFLGDSVIDRLREGGGAILNFDWPSHRQRKKQEPQ